MILKTSIDSKSKFFQIKEVCGESFNLIEKFSYGVFGSLRYRIKNIFTKTTLSEISNYNSIVYANFEIRKKGLVMFFRFKNDQYAIFGRLNQITFQSSKNKFDIQIENELISLEILNSKKHKSFINNLTKIRSQNIKI